MWNRISRLWCRAMHQKAMWPIHGKYICRQCLQEYRLEWEEPVQTTEHANPAVRKQGVAEPAPAAVVQ